MVGQACASSRLARKGLVQKKNHRMVGQACASSRLARKGLVLVTTNTNQK